MCDNNLIQKLREEFSHYQYIDCLNCSNSFSDEDDALHCIVHNKIVDENDLCIDFNL